MQKSRDNSASLVAVSDVRLRINRRKVLTVDEFKIHRGEHWCVLGGNGAGKSLLAQLIRGQLPRARQHLRYSPGFDPKTDMDVVSFEEQQQLWARDNRHDISEFSSAASDPGTTVRQLICRNNGPGLLAGEPAREILAVLQIDSLLESGIRYLSSGQIRKAMLARALLGHAAPPGRLLVLDDPLEAIDRQAQPGVRNLLSRWMSGDNASLLLCRRQGEVLPGITHLALMEDLQLIAQGPVDKVRVSRDFARVVKKPAAQPGSIPVNRNRQSALTDPVAPVLLEEVSAAYGDTLVLNRVTWRMEPGQHTLIEGPNGCGKSTLLSLIDGENHKAYGQRVTLFGRRRGSGESVWDIKSHFGVVSNEIHNKYVKGWRVLDVVVSGYYDSVGLYDDSGASQAEYALAWLQSLGLAELSREYFHELSFGQQRLVLVARAMVKAPDVLILDEPCVGLDDYYRQLVLAVVDCIAEQTKTQLIYVSHTEGEEPACINQRLRFEPAAGGGYHLVER